MSKSQSQRRSRLLRAGVVMATIAATVIASATPAQAAAVTLTLNSANGPSGVASVKITASNAAAWLAGVTTPKATLSLPACQTTYNTTASTEVTPSTATVGNILTGVVATKITNYKAYITLPSIPQSPDSATSTAYKVCVYSGTATTDVLLGSTTYTVAGASTLAGTPIAPATGPALGGTLITVTGTGFPTGAGAITATLGGTALTSITPVSATKFTAITPYHASGAVALTVTTTAGTASAQNAFTYANGITISPNTSPTGVAAVYIDVIGAGFQGYTFGTVTLATEVAATGTATTGARVFLYDGTTTSLNLTGTTSTYGAGPTAECTGVAVISDSELICALNLADTLNPTTAVAGADVAAGTYTMTVVSDAEPGAVYTKSDLSSGATFTVAPY